MNNVYYIGLFLHSEIILTPSHLRNFLLMLWMDLRNDATYSHLTVTLQTGPNKNQNQMDLMARSCYAIHSNMHDSEAFHRGISGIYLIKHSKPTTQHQRD